MLALVVGKEKERVERRGETLLWLLGREEEEKFLLVAEPALLDLWKRESCSFVVGRKRRRNGN